MLRRIFLGAFGVAAIASADDPIKLLVQGATDVELGPLLDALEGRQATQIAAWTFWEGRIGATRVAVSRTEVGPINAVAATVLGIDRYKPVLIINQGTAGAHNPSHLRVPEWVPVSTQRAGNPILTVCDWMAAN